jgi:hypothetical protein
MIPVPMRQLYDLDTANVCFQACRILLPGLLFGTNIKEDGMAKVAFSGRLCRLMLDLGLSFACFFPRNYSSYGFSFFIFLFNWFERERERFEIVLSDTNHHD